MDNWERKEGEKKEREWWEIITKETEINKSGNSR